jgi:type II secretory pathway component PulK
VSPLPGPKRRGESGTALVMALLVLFLVSVSLTLLAFSLQIRMRLVREDAESIILGALSDAAVDEAVAGLALDSSYTGATKHDFGKGTIESKVESLGPGLYDVVATAVYDGRKRVVDAQVFRAPGEAYVRNWRRVPG